MTHPIGFPLDLEQGRRIPYWLSSSMARQEPPEEPGSEYIFQLRPSTKVSRQQQPSKVSRARLWGPNHLLKATEAPHSLLHRERPTLGPTIR